MSNETLEVRPFKKERHVLTKAGEILAVPDDWSFLPPGDAALTGRVKKSGPSWTVKEPKARKLISRGVWAPSETIQANRMRLLIERQAPSYQRKLDASRQRRAKEQEAYAEDFQQAVFDFLDFHPGHDSLGRKLSQLIAEHAVPVGSGTVARTKRIPIEQRAEAATIAWMRHQTTAYDNMSIPMIKGKRRETRQLLAKQSKAILNKYRSADDFDTNTCPLFKAVQ